MKPINSREKSKQLWQFIIIFCGLALVPVALIFFSYYRVPEEISESEAQKLVNYSHFEHTQKRVMIKMWEVDSNINLYADATTPNPEFLQKKIVDGISDLGKMDTTIKMVQLVRKSYEDHYRHVRLMLEAQEEKRNALLKQKEAEDKAKTLQSHPMMGMENPMPGQ